MAVGSSTNEMMHLLQMIIPLADEEGTYLGYVTKDQFLELLGRSEAAVRKDVEDEYNAIFEFSADGLFVADADGVVLRLNPACEIIDEVNACDVVGHSMVEMVAQGYYSESATLKVLEEKRTVSILQKTKTGKEILATGTPVYRNGSLFRILVNSRDITQFNDLKRQLEQAIMKTQRIESELDRWRSQSQINNQVLFVGEKSQRCLELAIRVAGVDSTVLLQGESGVGKEVIGRLIHKSSKRKDRSFIKIDCSSIPGNLLESELFGYERGAFTGANKEGKPGLIELAHEGTLFLDEIGELPPGLQAKLLRVLQDREIIRLGGKKPMLVDVRVIAATNRDLAQMVKDKTFREDLYYRLNVVPIRVPSLRERKEDIGPLVLHFIKKFNDKYDLAKEMRPNAMKILLEYRWPGNIRELENLMERLVVTTERDGIESDDLPLYLMEGHTDMKITTLSYREASEEFEKRLFTAAMQQSESTHQMAKILEIDASTVRRKLRKLGLKPLFE
jgi:PAS domain S-box-containing protein